MPETKLKFKWQLTQAAFDRLLAALSPNRDDAGEKYLLLKNNLVRFFEARGFSAAEDAADEVLNRLARKLENGETLENPNTYALGIARLVALELRKNPIFSATDEIPEIAAMPVDTEKEENEEKLKCLSKCLNELTTENKEIIVGY